MSYSDTNVEHAALGNELVKQLVTALATDQKIEAIKLYRQLTGTHLGDAKYAIESVTNKFFNGSSDYKSLDYFVFFRFSEYDNWSCHGPFYSRSIADERAKEICQDPDVIEVKITNVVASSQRKLEMVSV